MTTRAFKGRAIGFALLAGVLVGACETHRSTTFDPVGDPAFDFTVAKGDVGAAAKPPIRSKLPGGRVDRVVARRLLQRYSVDTVWLAAPDTGFSAITITLLTLPSGNTQDTLTRDSAVAVTARYLRGLSGGVYQVWNQGPDGVITPVYGRIVEYFKYFSGNTTVIGDSIFNPDSTVIAANGTGTYAGSEDPVVDSVAFQILDYDAANTVNPFTNTGTNTIFLSIESAPATTPSTAQFLWHRIGLVATGAATTTPFRDTVWISANTDSTVPDTIEISRSERLTRAGSGEALFGNYGGLDLINAASPSDYTYGLIGAGMGGARGPEVSADLTEVARPPVGFFYRGYIVNNVGVGVVVDTARAPWSSDSTVSRVSLFDADVDPLLPGVVRGDIRALNVRNCASGAAVLNCQNSMGLPATGTFATQAAFVIKLEPKGVAGLGPEKSVVFVGALPDEVK